MKIYTVRATFSFVLNTTKAFDRKCEGGNVFNTSRLDFCHCYECVKLSIDYFRNLYPVCVKIEFMPSHRAVSSARINLGSSFTHLLRCSIFVWICYTFSSICSCFLFGLPEYLMSRIIERRYTKWSACSLDSLFRQYASPYLELLCASGKAPNFPKSTADLPIHLLMSPKKNAWIVVTQKGAVLFTLCFVFIKMASSKTEKTKAFLNLRLNFRKIYQVIFGLDSKISLTFGQKCFLYSPLLFIM